MSRSLLVDTGDARLHVEDVGTGAPLVVLHGFTGSGRAMTPIVDRLSKRHRVITVDLVGHGRSSTPRSPDAYSVASNVRQVLSVADVLGLATFHLVGYSMGGRIALTIACDAAHRLRSLTLIGATAGLADPKARAERRRLDEARALRIEEDFEAFVDEWMANPLFAGQARLGDAHLARERARRLENDPAGLAASLRGAGTGAMEPLHGRLERCTVPTLLMVGGEDSKFRELTAELEELIPHPSKTVVEGAGHSAHLEQPDAVAGRIGEFVSVIEAT